MHAIWPTVHFRNITPSGNTCCRRSEETALAAITPVGLCLMKHSLLVTRSTTVWLMCMQTLPIISALALFGTIAIVSCIIISLGPIAHVEQNSKTYSAVAPPRYLWFCDASELCMACHVQLEYGPSLTQWCLPSLSMLGWMCKVAGETAQSDNTDAHLSGGF